MRDTNQYLRTYCKTCKDFVFHIEKIRFPDKDAQQQDDLTMKQTVYYVHEECGTEFTPYTLSEVDDEKIKQQRQRYKEFRRSNFRKTLNLFAVMGLGFNMPDLKEGKYFESDAGLQLVEERLREAIRKKKEEQQAELLKFKDVGRNERCLCGSGKKYKHCCLQVHSTSGYGKGY